MTQNKIEVGRTKALIPEHRFDTTDLGVSLYNTMFDLFSRFSNDSVRCRTQSFSLASNDSIVFSHNIGQQSSEIEAKIFVSGVELTDEQIQSDFAIVHQSNDALLLQNVSGANKTGWLICSGMLQNRADQVRLRTRSSSPSTVSTGEIAIFSQNDNVFAKNSLGTVMSLTDSVVIQAPPGVILSYVGTSAPSGYLMCDGSQVSRTTYSSLFNIIGISHGNGDGLSTFHLPDYRGRFLRGVDGAAGNDPDSAIRTAMHPGGNSGNSVGSVQDHAHESHNHAQNSHNHTQNAHNHAQVPHNHTQNSHNHTQNPHTHLIPQIVGFSGKFSSGNLVSLDYTGIDDPTSSTTATNQYTEAINQATTAGNYAVTAENIATTATNQATGGNETRPLNAYVNYIIKF